MSLSSFPSGVGTTVVRTLVAASLMGLAGCSLRGPEKDTAVTITTPIRTYLDGAGASFPAPIYLRWFEEMAKQGVQVNYDSVGSSAGLLALQQNTVHFAASDVPMKAEEVAKERQGVVQIPMTAGAIVVAYQHKGCDLKLSQAQLVGIFQGTITNYGQLGCTAKPIQVVVRSDGSGTTANFTAHLAAIDHGWKQKVGSGKSVPWPVGTKVKGNEGVATHLLKTDGALGYVDAAYVKPPLRAASLTNASGQVVSPTPENKREALAAIDLGPHLVGRDPNPKKGYPIVTYSWILVPKTGNGTAPHDSLMKVFGYALSDPAQAMAERLGYVSLPQSVLEKSRSALATIEP